MEKIVASALIVVCVLLVPASCFRIPRQANRPSFAGITGGNWENLVGQIIPPGTPWPAKAEDYSTTLKPTIATKVSVPDDQTTSNIDKHYSKSTTSSPSIVLEHQPNRPSFAGSTGGNWQTLPTSTSTTSTTPSKHEDSEPTTVLEHRPQRPSFAGIGNSENNLSQKEPSTSVPEDQGTTSSKDEENTQPSIVLEYQPNRPSFAGSTGGTWETSQNSSLKPEKDKVSYVHISLNADDIKAALGNHNASQFLILALNLNNLKGKSETDCKPEAVSVAEITSSIPVLSILLNVETLKSILIGT